MATHLALIRAINVGGRNKLPMIQLRSVAEQLGHSRIQTYIQSGNLLFDPGPGSGDPGKLAGGLEQALEETIGWRPSVVVMSLETLAGAAARSPFVGSPPQSHHLAFFSLGAGPPPADLEKATRAAAERPDGERAEAVGDVVYLLLPSGMGRSRLAGDLSKGATAPLRGATIRNWATVHKLIGMAEDDPPPMV